MAGKIKMDFPEIPRNMRPIQLGFVPKRDCAPLVFAHESGLFERYELAVELRRETRWADIRDKIIYGELDAAHAPATLPFITNLGLDSDECATVSGLILSLQGNGIVLSRQLWEEGVRDASTLRDLIYRNWSRRTYTFAVAFPHSPAFFLLRRWLLSGGVVPHVELAIKVVPPEQMFPTLKLGYIDGYCCGEPWISLAAEAQVGTRVATSAELAPFHPEKALMVRRDFAHDRAGEHERLIAALIEACEFCDRPENGPLLSQMLAQPRYLNAPAECLKERGTHSDSGPEADPGTSPLFHKCNANDPTDDKAAWLLGHLYEIMDQEILKPRSCRRMPVLKNVFRRDIYQRARTALVNQAQRLKQEVDSFETGLKRSA